MSAAVDFSRTQQIQWLASDPGSSAWVVANAGSGKTHVLTQRVMRLLLAGADPASILCLTFTKVAAAEMSRRIFAKLGRWTRLPGNELAAELHGAQGRPPTAAEIKAARRLFARALETPGGLKIQTIHAFCEKLLHQFPFEANVPGHFAVLDETGAAALLADARSQVLAAAARAPESRLGKAVRFLAEHATDWQIKTALDAVIANREPLRAWITRAGELGEAGGIDDALEDLREKLGLETGETAEALGETICRAANWAGLDCHELTEALEQAASGNQLDDRARAELLKINSAGDPIVEALARISFFTTTRDGTVVVRSVSGRFGASFRKSRPDLDGHFSAEAERLIAIAGKLNAARALAATEALLVVGDAILNEYALAKRYAGQLDFDDLIVKARNLLSRSDAASWVLYKLDARIDHILVDEAQDTSPDQWSIVRQLAADFFSGETAARGERTIFAVGDDKQSIFGFQGAAPKMLADMARFFERLVKAGGREFVSVPLQLSFRSTSEILGGVDKVFDGELRRRVTSFDYEIHSANRLHDPGKIVVMPRRVRARAEQPEDWTQPYDAPTSVDMAVAEDVAREIKALIGTRLSSGKLVRPGEILILGRKRDAFFTAVNRALLAAGVPTAGADRIPVATHIAVLDLLALADVMLLPEDELQLAACLKSPLLGLTEDELMHLAIGRKGSLWRALRDSAEPRIAEAAAKVRRWRASADQVTPFRFFAEVLGPDGGRRAFRERLGSEADDVLDAFLSQALSFENLGPPTLQGFSAFIRANEGDIKREAEEAGAGVRVMTVHGAKGLEADVVFLIDTGGLIVVNQHRDCLVDIGDGQGPAFLWRRKSDEAPEPQLRADEIADNETQNEYLRLLYVAMTRARDVLYVGGIRPNRREVEGCWYARVRDALVPADAERDPETGELAQAFFWPQQARLPLQGEPERATEAAQPGPLAVPGWIFQPAPSPAIAPQPLRPSRGLAEPDPQAEPASRSETRTSADPLGGIDARLRGNAIHRLLETLPAIPVPDRPAAAARLLAGILPPDSAGVDAALAEAEAVLAHPGLAEFFGPDSRAEVPIVGNVRLPGSAKDYAVSGQIDRLLRTPSGWRILDFKTNRAVPETLDEVEPAYILQLALYRNLLMEMVPGAAVEATIVWTAGPQLMPIPADRMEQASAKLASRAKPVP